MEFSTFLLSELLKSDMIVVMSVVLSHEYGSIVRDVTVGNTLGAAMYFCNIAM